MLNLKETGEDMRFKNKELTDINGSQETNLSSDSLKDQHIARLSKRKEGGRKKREEAEREEDNSAMRKKEMKEAERKGNKRDNYIM